MTSDGLLSTYHGFDYIKRPLFLSSTDTTEFRLVYLTVGIVKFFHRFRAFRKLAKNVARNIDIRQKFHSGYICFNAAEHSWAWTGSRTFTTHDAELQNFIHKKSMQFDYLIDIGSNIGVMTVGTLLNNPTIKAVAIDPNRKALSLLQKTLALNRLDERCTVINAVVGAEDGFIKFNDEGSVTGHVAADGHTVRMIKFSDLLNEYSSYRTLVKIDIEGYESVLVRDFSAVRALYNCTFVIELHEAGFNDTGDPEFVMDSLRALGADITDVRNMPVHHVDVDRISQVVVTFA